ncbi:hypothetical protein [Streptomyces sp. NPDC006355]|uniref:hypothetical protein n=1 Tax=Streptomyces sp. NPDC006355 TaxID=3156758 RepID=UPI00339F2DDC
MTHTPLTEEQLDRYAELAITAEHDGIKVDPAVVTVLVDEVRRLQTQRRFLMRALAKRDAASGNADRAVREFLAPGPAEDPDDDESDELDDEIPNPPYDPPVGTTWRQWHGG